MVPASSSIPLRLKAGIAFVLAILLLVTTILMPVQAPLLAQGNGIQESGTQESGTQSIAAAQGESQITTSVYVVRRGDTLGAIARRYNTTVATLLRLNPQIRNPNRLYIGQRIRVPVVAQPPTEEPSGFTITRIHLISLNDGGPLGCGDTVVPVTQEIAATRAVLRATLERLLSIKSQYYGESGLYNALYQSQLTLDDVRIDNRIATIRLSGQIVLGGVCDTPRVQAQLEQAALQFSTVDQVQIFINGVRLQDALN
jgi:LysM repeat protein